MAAIAWVVLSCMSPRLAAHAQQQSVRMDAPGHQAINLTLAQLQALPASKVAVSFQTEHGEEHATYRGALLWTVLEHSGMLTPVPRDHVRQVVTITGLDGYTAVLALAEIDPSFEGKSVLLADIRNGAPTENLPRLIVPGDRYGGRSVRDVVTISIH